MTTRLSRAYGFWGLAAACVALAAWGYTVWLPYRLSSFQHRLLPVLAYVQLVMSLISVVLGIAARKGGGRGLGFVCLILGFLGFVLAMIPHVHSWSPGVSGRFVPNQALQATAAAPAVFTFDLSPVAVVASASALPAAVPELGRSTT